MSAKADNRFADALQKTRISIRATLLFLAPSPCPGKFNLLLT